jgi:hypothetical protein
MANYSLVVGSKFSPFTYQELLEPAVSATKAHQELENQYSELSTKASVWEGLANEQTDPEAYATYKAYSEELKKQADQLTSQGLSIGSRKAVADLKSRYSSDIVPIENAYTRRKELVDEQRKLRNADNTLMFDVDASTLSLDDLIKNPQLGYQSYSGALIAKQVGDAAKNLAKEIRNNPREWKPILEDQYFQTMMQKGYTTEEILLAASQDPNAPTALTNLVNTAVESTGISNWKGVKDAEGNLTNYGRQLLEKARDYGVQGLWNAVGDTQYQVQSNKAYDYAMREAAAIRAEEREQRRKEGEKGETHAKETKPIHFGPRVGIGAVGEENKALGVLEGLRQTPRGFSTTKIDNAQIELDRLTAELSKYSDEDLQRFRSYDTTSNFNTTPGQIKSPAPKGYNEYKKLQSKLIAAKNTYDSAIEEIAPLIEKYSHLGRNTYEQLTIGRELDAIQQSQEKTAFPLAIKDSDYNNIRKGIFNVLSQSEDEMNSGAIGLRDSKGKIVKYDDFEKIKEDSANVIVRILGGNNPEIQLVHDGKTYSIEGIIQLDDYNRDLKVVNDYLKDFSKDITNSITPITKKEYETFLKDEVVNIKPSSVNIQRIPGSNYYGTVLYNAEIGDYIKVILDSNYNIVATNSLVDELSGASNRDSEFIKRATSGLMGLSDLFAYED